MIQPEAQKNEEQKCSSLCVFFDTGKRVRKSAVAQILPGPLVPRKWREGCLSSSCSALFGGLFISATLDEDK